MLHFSKVSRVVTQIVSSKSGSEADTSHSKEAGLVIYLAFLAKVANLYYMILTAFKKYWSDTVVRFESGTQDKFV